MEISKTTKLTDSVKHIRKKVFMEEQGFENEFDDIDCISTHILIYDKLKPVATCRLFYNKVRQSYVIGRIAVLKEYRGNNYGSKLLKAAEQEIVNNQGKWAELLAQVRASDFYEKNGYIKSAEICDDEGCPHVWMRKKLI
ncbi:GNAT family N-acetyltransferase [uncultured Eubacterium sp.]|jgi:acetyltransferase, GNAT family|uniref:GNAT family N-acetyltransferase n=1 Tax=uncultured Eubacterium sp. TaxID=165185 RepID=UPI0028039DB2|nr:GNAT family N-acetyltransferase [uncultured Eubacterium sp.]